MLEAVGSPPGIPQIRPDDMTTEASTTNSAGGNAEKADSQAEAEAAVMALLEADDPGEVDAGGAITEEDRDRLLKDDDDQQEEEAVQMELAEEDRLDFEPEDEDEVEEAVDKAATVALDVAPGSQAEAVQQKKAEKDE